MLTTLKEIITPEAYLEAERKNSASKNEFINGEVIHMSGASLNHNTITSNVVILLGSLLWNKNFLIHQSDMRVHNPVDNSYFYPDIVVIEGEAQLLDDEFDNLLNPVLIAEVLSPGTEGYDRGDKAHFYRHIPSLKEYLIVSQKEALAEHWVKIDETKWQLEEIKGLDNKLLLLNASCEIRMADIYKKVKLKS